jgi:phenylacetate-CoA ligase
MHAFVLSMWIAGTPVVDLIQNFGACVVPIGTMTGIERFAQIAQEVFPVALNCTPSYAEYLIKNLPNRAGIDANQFGIKKIMLGGEPGGGIPHIRERIEKAFFGAMVYDVIGSTHAVFLSSVSCEAYAGMHFLAEDYCLFEIVDPKTLEVLPFENGVEGEVVLTGLQKECAPAIRLREKDMVQVFTEPCECGKPCFRFFVKGRSDDMLLVRGVNVYPHAIKDVINNFQPQVTGAIKIVLYHPPPVADPPLPIRVELAKDIPIENQDLLAKKIEDKLHHNLRFRAKVEIVPYGAFEGTLGLTRKASLFDKHFESKV